jgi:hypothetical protein
VFKSSIPNTINTPTSDIVNNNICIANSTI